MTEAQFPTWRPSASAWSRKAETDALMSAVVRQTSAAPRSEILGPGHELADAHLLLGGLAYRYKVLVDGGRQITAVLMPGDICDLEAVMCGRADYSVTALSKCVIGAIPAARLTAAIMAEPCMTQALWRRLLLDAAISREWLVRLGRLTALEGMAHLLCELRVRFTAAGLAADEHMDIRLTQLQLGNILGMSTVHANRVLQQLREARLIAFSGGILTILQVPALETLAKFNPAYLQNP